MTAMMEDRDYKVLWAVVDSYISNPDPVGSRFVTKKYAFNLSSATIRNIMADLEDMGYLHQPHTSAGRVPTDKGYRFYVDSLSQEAEGSNAAYIDELFSRIGHMKNDINSFLEGTTKALSMLSHYLGIALPPKSDRSRLKKISIIRHKEDHAAVVFLTREGIVKNSIITVDSDLTQRDLNRMAEYLNGEFAGFTIDEIRSILLKELYRDKVLCDTLISRATCLCQKALCFDYSTLFISGLSEVLGLPDFSDLDRIKEISKTIEDKRLIIKLLDKLSESDGIRVIIGSENPAAEMRKLSMVVSTYKEGARTIGTLGVIGPTRMDYSKAITIVDRTAKYITRVFSEG